MPIRACTNPQTTPPMAQKAQNGTWKPRKLFSLPEKSMTKATTVHRPMMMPLMELETRFPSAPESSKPCSSLSPTSLP